MTSLGKTLDPYLFFELRSQSKVKVLDYHLTKPLIAYVSINNMLGIWDLDRKTCLKNFNISALESKDLSKSVAIKAVKFFDRDILNSMFPNDASDNESPFYLCSWLIAVAEAKVYFYDYVSEKIEVVTPALLDNKLPKCVEIVDSRYIAIGCSDGFVKILDVVLWNVSKTIKGFHHKTINHVLAYKPYDAVKPRLVVSSLDGTMACWNIDSEAPLFKFNMLKSGKPILTANNLEDVTSISYNRANNQIVTVTEHYITMWNSQTGDEIIRYKNIKDSHKVSLVEASFLHYGSLNKDLMVGHAKSSELMIFDVGKGLRSKDATTTLDCFTIMDFKNLKDFEKNFRIYSAKTHFEKPHLLFVATSQGVFAISLMKLGAGVSFISSPFYSIYMMPSQTKPFLNEDGTVKKLDNNAIQKIQSFEIVDIGNRLPNILFLSVSNELIYCHILDRTKIDLLPETPQGAIAKTVIGQADSVPIDEEFELKSSLDGKYFSIRYLKSGLFSVYAITNKNISFPRESDNTMVLDNLHPIGCVEKIFSSCASSLEWHQEKNEFAALVPVTKEGKPIEVKEKIETVSKGGFFGSKVTKRVLQANTSDIAKSVLYIFQVKPEGGAVKVQVKAKNDTLIDPKKLFGGPFYTVIDNINEADFNELMNSELEPIKRDLRSVMNIKMNFLEYNDAMQQFEKIGKPMLAAENLYWNLSATLLVAAYRTSFFVYRYNPMEKNFKYQQTVSRKILEGFFWENLFFYITETSIRVAVLDFQDEVVDIVLAEDNQEPNYLAEIYFEEYFMKDDEFIFDTLYPQPQLKPPGHLRILGIYDYKLILATSKEEFYKIDLDHPFLKICLNLQFGNGMECISELKRIDQKAWGPVFELFEIYKQFREADTLLSLLQDPDLKNQCILKRSFLRDAKESLSEIELTPTTPLTIQESLALDYFAHYEAAPNLDLSTIKGSENSSVLNVLCHEKSLTEFAKKHPSLNFALGDRVDPEQRSLKEYFEKLISLGN